MTVAGEACLAPACSYPACPRGTNPDQGDADRDGIGDTCDSRPLPPPPAAGEPSTVAVAGTMQSEVGCDPEWSGDEIVFRFNATTKVLTMTTP